MLDPSVDVDNFVEEFGVEVTWHSNTKDLDAQAGSPIESFKTKKIRVILTERSRDERILDAGKIDQEILSMFCKVGDNIQIDDKISTPSGIDYKVIKLMSQAIFSDKSSEINFSTAGRRFGISRAVSDGN